MDINSNNDITEVFDKVYSLTCPHCGVYSALTPISFPHYELVKRFKPYRVGIVYRCNACNEPIFLRFEVNVNPGKSFISMSENFEEIERSKETFDFQYLSTEVLENFKEALTCFSNYCFNAFGAMCRRCVQSISTELGAKGKDKVQKQLEELKEIAPIDDDTYEILEQIIIAGHDGAHPHLPKLSPERAKILLELMKDVLYQLFVRKAKLQETTDLRKKQIEQDNK